MMYKTNLLLVALLILLQLSACDNKPNRQKTIDPDNKKEIVVPANKGYFEPWADNERASVPHFNPDADTDDVKNWVSGDKNMVWYFNLNEGVYNVNMDMMLADKAKSSFQFIVSATEGDYFAQQDIIIEAEGSGGFQKIFFDGLNIPKQAFYRFELKPKSKTGEQYAVLRNFIFETPADKGGSARYSRWLTTPSVHLSFKPEDEQKHEYDWLYGEIRVPKGYDPMYTFYMCIGYYRGYFGIQVNSSTERRVLFSVWDSSDEGIDRGKVKAEDRVTLLGKNPEVQANDFGNEGTGGQSYWRYPWVTDVPVKFVMNMRKLPGNYAVYSAWFNDTETDEWKYMASWRAPREDRYFDGFYSFLENYGPGTGQSVRKAHYYNCWGKRVDNKEWIELNRAKLTHTDGSAEGRSDYGGGILTDNKHIMYMSSGGYTEPVDDKAPVISDKTDNPPMLNLEKLIQEVDKAVDSAK